MAWTPPKQTMTTKGNRTQVGGAKTRVNRPPSGSFENNRAVLPRKSAARRPRTRSGDCAKRSGPGLMPKEIGSASMIAVVPLPGTPAVSIGTGAPPAPGRR